MTARIIPFPLDRVLGPNDMLMPEDQSMLPDAEVIKLHPVTLELDETVDPEILQSRAHQ